MTVPRFEKGDEVRHRLHRHAVGVIVAKPRLINGEYWYTVRFGDRRENVDEQNLEPASGERDLDTLLAENAWGGKETLSKIVTFTKLKQPLTDVIYSFRASRTQFHAYQFKPVLKLLNSDRGRLLIADEVGLGKTIEAGYILQELKARGPVDRALIVCPSSLRQKWRDEMAARFDERFEILNAAGVRSLLAELEALGAGHRFQAICSIQTLRGARRRPRPRAEEDDSADWESSADRSPSLLDLFEAAAPPLDFVVVDEAHHMRNPHTNTNRLGEVLSALADVMLMLTATPIHIGSQNLFHLLRILSPDEFDSLEFFERHVRANEFVIRADRALRRYPPDFRTCRRELTRVEATAERARYLSNPLYPEVLYGLEHGDGRDRGQIIELQHDLSRLNALSHVLTRTRKREVQESRPQRSAQVIRVNWTEEESEFYRVVTDYCYRRYAALHGELAAQFAVIMLQRQVASCIPALFPRGAQAADEGLLEAGAEDVDSAFLDDVDESELSTGIWDDPEFLGLLQEWDGHIVRDTKFDELGHTLDQISEQDPNRKLIIFSYFKRTLAYLAERLEAMNIVSEVIHGDVPSNPADPDSDERGKRIRRFREDPEVRVLLSSEVGSEGLDFQFCNTLINYDLPWNPMVVEQRIGRVDRIGQRSAKIVIFNFSIPGTIEDRILTRLYKRIRVFEEAIGDLEPIIGAEIRQLTREIFSTRLSSAEMDRLIEDRARALERRRFDEQKLEQESGQFIGQDQYFVEEIERISQRKRFLSPSELETFVQEFLELEFPQRMWSPTSPEGCFTLRWATDLDEFVRNQFTKIERAEMAFFQRAHGRTLRVTCDADVANANPGVELFTAGHPFIRAIVHHYDTNQDRLHPVAALAVESSSIPHDDFLYSLYLVNAYGAQRSRQLEAVFVDPECNVIDRDTSEEILTAMVTTGRSLGDAPEVPGPELDRLAHAAEQELGRRIAQRREALARTNDALAAHRLASLRASHEAKRGKWQARLDKAHAGNAKPNYVRMLEGALRNMDVEFKKREAAIEQSRELDIRWHRFAAGIVRVV